jgi:hypothetical protein
MKWKGIVFSLLPSFQEVALSSLKAAHMQMPENLRWLFDQKNPQAKTGLVITSYETHKARTAKRVVELVAPDEHYHPPSFLPSSSPQITSSIQYNTCSFITSISSPCMMTEGNSRIEELEIW